LIASLVDLGERILVTSHTNAAVDQALYETIKTEEGQESGPLAESSYLSEHRLLRIGSKVANKIPAAARLNDAIEYKAREISNEILGLERKAGPLFDRRSTLKDHIAEWNKLDERREKVSETQKHLQISKMDFESSRHKVVDSQHALNEKISELERAKAAWLFRGSRTAKALSAVETAERSLTAIENRASAAEDQYQRLLAYLSLLNKEVSKQEMTCSHIRPRDIVERELSLLEIELKPLEERIHQLHEMKSQVEERLLNDAKAVFGTLTKCYLGKELEGQQFDAVIIDEVSMALPPLVFMAASIATKRLIVVGDFLQLPPVVRSDSDITNERLKVDTFHLAGIAQDFIPIAKSKVLQRLSVQRRMLPEISAVANYLVYARATK
jgi:hypothetical protein